jgi:hypothetical protein
MLSYDIDREAASEIGRRLLDVVDRQIVIAGYCFRIGFSIGVALIPEGSPRKCRPRYGKSAASSSA